MGVRIEFYRLLYLALYACWLKWRFILCICLITPIATGIFSAKANKTYRSHTTILIQESSLLNPFLEDLSVSYNLKTRMDALRTLVGSRHVLSGVIKDTELVTNPSEVEVERLIARLSAATKVDLIGSDLVKITLTWPKPEQVAPILSSIAMHFIERVLAPSTRSLKDSETFLQRQLDMMRGQLDASEQALADFKRQHHQQLPELYAANRQSLERMEKALQEKQVEKSGAEAALKNMLSKLTQSNPVLGAIEESIVRAESELTLLKTRYTAKHSKVQAVSRTLSSLKQKQASLISQKVELTEADIESLWQRAIVASDKGEMEDSLLVSQIKQLQQMKSKTEQLAQELSMLTEQKSVIAKRIAESSSIAQELNVLERDHQVKTDLYRELLNRYEMARVTEELGRFEQPNKIKVIDEAVRPRVPINLPIGLVVTVALIVSGLIAVSLCVFLFMVDGRIRDKYAASQISGLTVIGVLPKV